MSTNQEKIEKRIRDMLQYESDDFFVNITLKDEVTDKLLNYQFLHIFNLITAFRTSNVVLDGSDTGTGKTFVAIALCYQLRLKPFIICPKSVTNSWIEVCRIFNVNPLGITNYESAKKGKQCNILNKKVESEYLKINPELDNERKYQWRLPKYSIIIFDEVHRCKNVDSENAKLLLSTKNQSKVLMLSATLSEKPESFYVFGYMLGFYRYMKQARNWIKGVMREDNVQISLSKKENALSKKIYPYKGSRMAISELGDNFPKNQICADSYTLNKKNTEEVNKLFDTYNSLVLKKNDDLNIKNFLVEISKVRQKIEEYKLPIFVELTQMYLENGHSVVIFMNFINNLKKLSQLLKTDCLLYGDLEDSEREKNIDDFQKNVKRVIICTLGTGSEGIGLHDLYGVPRVTLISPTWNAQALKQAFGRTARSGSKSPALQRVIYSTSICEEAMCNKMKEKIKFLDKLTDDDLSP